MSDGRPRLDTALEVAAGVALTAASVPLLTGAHSVGLGPWILSVREPWRPAAAAVILLAVRAALAWRTARRGRNAAAGSAMESAATVLFSFGIASALLLWAHLHVPFCGGLDSYGYVSAAQALSAGRPVQPQPMVAWLPFARAIDAATPLGWTAAPSGTAIVPGYPLGFPLVMAMAIIIGGTGAAFYVPLVAGIGIVALAYLLTRRMAGPFAGAATAVVVAWNPVLMNMTVQPMSDAPAAFWYLLALTLLAGTRPRPAAAGLAFGLAIWTRPLVFALAPALLFLLPRRRQAFLGFAAGAAPVFLAMAGMQWYLYGSPLRTGYGGAAGLFTTKNIGRHLGAFARWTAAVHGPALVAAFGAGLWRAPRRLAAASAIGLACGVAPYIFNMQFFDDWDVVRYLLPGLVPGVIVASLGAFSLAQVLLRGRAALLGMLLFTAAVSVGSYRLVAGQSTWRLVRQESRYEAVAAWIAQHTPAATLVFADLHSGSLRLYADRPTLRWVRMPVGSLSATVREAQRRGYEMYAVLDDETERRSFERHAASGGEHLLVEPEAQVRGVLISRVSPGPAVMPGASGAPHGAGTNGAARGPVDGSSPSPSSRAAR